MVKARDTTVHLLRADADSGSSRHLPTHLLIHPMASGATFWLDVIRPLSVYGSVIAPDLPGAVLGQTRVPNRYASQAGPSAKFVRALTATLGLNHVVVHGWSFGGLVALLFANLHPVHVQRLVLTNPTLPGPLTPTQHAGWQTVGRLALFMGPPIARVLLPALGPTLVSVKLQALSAQPLQRLDIAGGDLSRCSPELIALVAEQLEELRARPRDLNAGVIAFASALSSMYVNRRVAREAIERVTVPTGLLWGDQDPLVERALMEDLIARRPNWKLLVFEGAGHLLPWEVPNTYVETVARWLEV
jgi:pimeloyl-ACP methyl ester carboxylesterase